MEFSNAIIDDINNACTSTAVESTHDVLLQKIKQIIPGLNFSHVLTRTGWYRTGGLFSSKNERIAHNLRDWLEAESDGDLSMLLDEYAESKLMVSTLQGKTHYFVVSTGEAADEFVQLEIEELQEVMDHILFSNETLPDDIEDVVDPVDVEKIPAEVVEAPHYIFRRITYIADYIKDLPQTLADKGNKSPAIQRFIQDWGYSSSNESATFCNHWVLSLQEYTDAYGEPVKQIKPVSTFVNELPEMELDESKHGLELANLIQNFDSVAGYPMAWYFFMLAHKKIPYYLAELIHRDLIGDYDYLPAKDFKVLVKWSAQPYAT